MSHMMRQQWRIQRGPNSEKFPSCPRPKPIIGQLIPAPPATSLGPLCKPWVGSIPHFVGLILCDGLTWWVPSHNLSATCFAMAGAGGFHPTPCWPTVLRWSELVGSIPQLVGQGADGFHPILYWPGLVGSIPPLGQSRQVPSHDCSATDFMCDVIARAGRFHPTPCWPTLYWPGLVGSIPPLMLSNGRSRQVPSHDCSARAVLS